uniref:Ion_trans_2 domain-containing protein n=1 Tax=Mesocestoides corti TaxID=53468 RepID=A0A5K3FE18_MESCO
MRWKSVLLCCLVFLDFRGHLFFFACCLKWKRKSFRRANGYDAADFIDRLPSSMLDDTEHLPLRRQTSVAGTRQADEVSVTTHTAEAPNVRDDLRDLEACVKRSEKERESEEAKADDDEDIDQIIASLTCPKLTTSSSSINPSRSSYPLGSSRPGATADTSVGELATLGFTNRNDYWEHSAFGRSRLTAILLSVIATVCLLYSLVATTWVYTGHPGNVTRRGLWRKCSMENGSCEITLPFLSETDGWQGGATCILVVAIMISFLGTGLAIFGHSGSDLVKRLYYFHSSGEIFFLAGFTTFLSFGIYRSYASMNLLNLRQTNPPSAFTTTSDQSPLASLPQPIRFGAADYTGWTAGVVFFAAAFALLIDEFIHELAKLGQSRWPCLARCLRCCAIRVTTFNRRLRTAQRSLAARCSSKSSRQHRQQHRQKSTSTTSSVTASATTRDRSGQTSGVVFSYKPTTGSSLATQRRRRRWRQRRQ